MREVLLWLTLYESGETSLITYTVMQEDYFVKFY
jgi:hypothetical protein